MKVKLIIIVVVALSLLSAPFYAVEESDFVQSKIIEEKTNANESNIDLSRSGMILDSLWCADANGDGQVNMLDITWIITCLYYQIWPPCDFSRWDPNNDGVANILDITFLVSYLYMGGPAPDCPPDTMPSGDLTGHTGCIENDDSRPWLPGNTECVEYLYDGSATLQLTHTNASFNCCFDSLTAIIDIENYLIDIVENEHPFGGLCDCNCYYDIDFEISNLPPDIYTIRVSNVYMENSETGEIIEFTVDLTQALSGIYCIGQQLIPRIH